MGGAITGGRVINSMLRVNWPPPPPQYIIYHHKLDRIDVGVLLLVPVILLLGEGVITGVVVESWERVVICCVDDWELCGIINDGEVYTNTTINLPWWYNNCHPSFLPM